MPFLGFLGIGLSKLKERGKCTNAVVEYSKKCYFIKVNTKAFRTNSFDGALFPSVIRYKYLVDGVQYTGWRYVDPFGNPPSIGSVINVYYLESSPGKSVADV